MATTTRPEGSSRIHSEHSSHGSRTPFQWGNGHAGAVMGAAVAGAAVGLAANAGRKLISQFANVNAGDWMEALKMEHEAALALFDKLQATNSSQAAHRHHLLMKLKHALTKHAAEEEMVIYPALRRVEGSGKADQLNADHGQVKSYLYELETMAKDDPQWLSRVADFRSAIERHVREEEQTLFPALHSRLTDEENAKLTSMMNKEGFRAA